MSEKTHKEFIADLNKRNVIFVFDDGETYSEAAFACFLTDEELEQVDEGGRKVKHVMDESGNGLVFDLSELVKESLQGKGSLTQT